MKINSQTIKLNPFIVQESPKKGKFRVVSVGIDLTQAPEWIGQTEKHHWIVILKFLEENRYEQYFFDCHDKCYKKEAI